MAIVPNLRAPSATPPNLPAYSVTLYRDDSWSSSSYTFDIRDFRKEKRQTISGTSLQDRATWIAFNLPAGTVVTLTNHVAAVDGTVFNLKNCGRVIDLIGTGRTEAVDLSKCNMNDVISSWFWHTPDMNLGAIELFEHAHLQGNRTVIFLSEWNAGEVHSLSGWHVKDRASSVRWDTLEDAQTASLFNHSDGSGASYENIKAWGSFKVIGSLKEVGFNDKISSFSWDNIRPMKEIVRPLEIPLNSSQSAVLSTSMNGTNNTSRKQKQTITYTSETAQSTTVTVTNQYTSGIETTYTKSSTVSAEAGLGGTSASVSQTVTWSVQLNFSYTNTQETSTTSTNTESLSISQVFIVPPQSTYNATLNVHMGKLPEGTAYTTTVDRWYEQQLRGSTLDPSTNNWYKRTETITFQMGGSLAAGTSLIMNSTKI